MPQSKIKVNVDYIKLKAEEKGGLYWLANELGIVYNTLNKYLKSGELRIQTLNKIAQVLDVKVESLIIVLK